MSSFDLQLRDIQKRYAETVVVNRFNLEIDKGEFVSLLGPSGCGKSTTLMMIAGFEMPSEGEILIRDRRVDMLAPENRRVGMMFQSYALFPHMSVSGNVEYGLKMRNVPKPERTPRVRRALEMVHMDSFIDRSPRMLSGGQQQRVALARALVTEPDILLLDEPFSALDRQLREDLQIEVRSLQRSLGITTIFVTHDQEEALLMSDRVVVMNGGRIEQCATPHELYRAPATEFVASFIGRGTFIDGMVLQVSAGEAMVETHLGSVVASVDAGQRSGSCRLFFRPEDAQLLAKADDGVAGLTVVASIKAVYFQGAITMVELAVPNSTDTVVVDASKEARTKTLEQGDSVTLHIPANRLRVFPGAASA